MLRYLILLAALCAHVLPVGATVTPTELPPADFTSRQYIDSKGCVFLRDGDGWTPRLARDETALCGYPPTLSARRQSPDQAISLYPEAAPKAGQVEAALVELVSAQARQGEVVVDPRERVRLADADDQADNAPAKELRAEMIAGPGIRSAIGQGLRPNQRLCDLLGHAQAGKRVAGSDPTEGFCGTLLALDIPRVAYAKPRAVTALKLPAQAGRAEKKVIASKKKPAARSGHKYVQIGVYADRRNADRAIRQVSALGMGIVRQRNRGAGPALHIIMAGPFADRAGLDAALRRIRAAGYRDAYTR